MYRCTHVNIIYVVLVVSNDEMNRRPLFSSKKGAKRSTLTCNGSLWIMMKLASRGEGVWKRVRKLLPGCNLWRVSRRWCWLCYQWLSTSNSAHRGRRASRTRSKVCCFFQNSWILSLFLWNVGLHKAIPQSDAWCSFYFLQRNTLGILIHFPQFSDSFINSQSHDVGCPSTFFLYM